MMPERKRSLRDLIFLQSANIVDGKEFVKIMEELKIVFGWRRRLAILFGSPLRVFLNNKIVGTFVDKNSGIFVEVKENPKLKKDDMECLFG